MLHMCGLFYIIGLSVTVLYLLDLWVFPQPSLNETIAAQLLALWREIKRDNQTQQHQTKD